jgi:manganese/iron transport system permease protein
MLLVGLAVAVGSAFGGVYLSFFLDSAPAPTIVLLLSAVFITAFAWTIIAARRTTTAPA